MKRSNYSQCGQWLLVEVTERDRMSDGAVWMMTRPAEKGSSEAGLGEDLSGVDELKMNLYINEPKTSTQTHL